MIRFVVYLLMIFSLVSTAWAMPPTAVPATPLLAADGTRIQSDRLVREGQWILILVRGGSGAGGAVLDFLAGLQPAMTPSKLVIVVSGGDRKALEDLKSQRKPIEGVAWYLDERDALFQGFGLKSSPAVLGMRKETAMWSVTGVPDAFQMDQMLRGWIGE